MEKLSKKASKVDCIVCETKVSTMETLKRSDSDMVRTFSQISGLSPLNCEEWIFCTMCFYELKIVTNFRKRCVQSNIILLKKVAEETSVKVEAELALFEANYSNQPLPQTKLEMELEKTDNPRDNPCLEKNTAAVPRNVRDFICEHCAKAFRTVKGLKGHSLIHSGEKPYKCHSCGKSFRFQPNLALHVKMHVDRRDYSCYLCKNKFRTKSCLTQHIQRVHEKLWKFKCELCPDRGFYSKKDLNYHMKVHFGLRDKSCQHCDRSFYNNSDLSVHMKKFHAEATAKKKSKQKSSDS